jgi:hypothetical protein
VTANFYEAGEHSERFGAAHRNQSRQTIDETLPALPRAMLQWPVLIPFLKYLILAWNGLLSSWISVVLFVVWMMVLSAMLVRAVAERGQQIFGDPISSAG